MKNFKNNNFKIIKNINDPKIILFRKKIDEIKSGNKMLKPECGQQSHVTWFKVFKNGPSTICERQPLKIWSDTICFGRSHRFKLLMAVFDKFYLVHSWISWPIWVRTYLTGSFGLRHDIIKNAWIIHYGKLIPEGSVSVTTIWENAAI